MELDLRYKQYELQQKENCVQDKSEDIITNNKQSCQATKPYQDIINYLQDKITKMSYKEVFSLMSTVQNQAQFSLDDGSQVIIGKTNGLINMVIISKDGSKFIASWTNFTDQKEYFEALKKIS